MNKVTPQTLQMVAHHLCHIFGIDMNADDIVIFIGSDEANNNGEAIKEWVANQNDLQSAPRRDMAIELRDRLSDVLFDLETAIRATP